MAENHVKISHPFTAQPPRVGWCRFLESAFPTAKPSRLIGRLKNSPYSCQRLIDAPPMLNVQM